MEEEEQNDKGEDEDDEEKEEEEAVDEAEIIKGFEDVSGSEDDADSSDEDEDEDDEQANRNAPIMAAKLPSSKDDAVVKQRLDKIAKRKQANKTVRPRLRSLTLPHLPLAISN